MAESGTDALPLLICGHRGIASADCFRCWLEAEVTRRYWEIFEEELPRFLGINTGQHEGPSTVG